LVKFIHTKKEEKATDKSKTKDKKVEEHRRSLFGVFKAFQSKKAQEKENTEVKGISVMHLPATEKSEIKVTGLPPIVPKEETKTKEEPKRGVLPAKKEDVKILATYNFVSDNIPITIRIYKKKGEFVPIYDVSISSITRNTEIILEKVRGELTAQVSLGMIDILATKETGIIEQRFIDTITTLINKHFPDADERKTPADAAHWQSLRLHVRPVRLGRRDQN